MRTAADVTLTVSLDRDDPRPLPRQLADELRRSINRGILSPGEPVPATRALAQRLAVSRGTVVAAYDQLLAEGYLAARVGRGTVVNPGLPTVHPPSVVPTLPAGPRHRGTPPPVDLRPGRPWTAGIANAAWRAAWRRAAAEPPSALPPAGLTTLRHELSDHLRRMRGVLRGPDQLLVTAGARDGLALLLHTLGGGLSVGVEDPGYPSLRRVPGRLGARVLPLATDADGLVCDDLPTGSAAPRVVIVTPSHQYPLGGSLPIARRLALLEWARAQGVWIVEDDYDSELRYTSAPLPALAALDDPDTGRVVTLGTFAKTIGPGLGAGFLVAPRLLMDPLLATRADLGQPVSQATQVALAGYLASGELRRHTQRMRREYRRRRRLVADVLAGLPGVRVMAMDGGLHAVVECRRPEQDVLAEARSGGVLVAGMSEYWSRSPATGGGIVLGYGGVSAETLGRGLTVLAGVLTG